MSARVNAAFEGPAGMLVAPVMARMNRDMERAALQAAPPTDNLAVLVVGCGPGVGLTELLDRGTPARVLAVDPSGAMLAAARRRVAAHGRGRVTPVEFIQIGAAGLGPERGRFSLAIAVNCHQLWDPRAESTEAVASRLEPGGSLVSLTHTWAIEKHGPLGLWQEEVDEELATAGFGPRTWSTAPYRSGNGLMVTASLPTDHHARRAYD